MVRPYGVKGSAAMPPNCKRLCCELGSISWPIDYQKSVLTSHPQRCAIFGKSGSHRAVTIPIYIKIYWKKNVKFFFNLIERKRTQRTHRSFINNVKECKECSVLFIKNAKERENVVFFWKECKITQERFPNPGKSHCMLYSTVDQEYVYAYVGIFLP